MDANTAFIPQADPQLGKPSALYVYRDEFGAPITAVFRFDVRTKGTNGAKSPKKEFRPFNVEMGEWKAPDVRPLYRLDLLATHKGPVVVVEGEKCADALNDLGILATTAFGGCNGVSKTDLSPLRGRDVIIWPDTDEAGEKYLHAVAKAIEGEAEPIANVSYIPNVTLRNTLRNVTKDPEADLFKGWDAADAIDVGFDTLRIEGMLKEAIPYLREPLRDLPPNVNVTRAHNVTLREKPDLFKEPPRFNDNVREWGEPDMSVLNPRSKPPVFPLGLFGPFWSKWIAGKAEGCGAPVDYVAASLLAATSTLIGNSYRVSPWQGWEEPAFLWLALVGNPSSGKSPAMDPVMSLLRRLERDKKMIADEAGFQYEADILAANFARKTWEKAVEEAAKSGRKAPMMPEEAREPDKPIAPRIAVADTTPEALARLMANQPKGLLVQRDELAAWIGNFNRYAGGQGGDRAFWLEAFGARSFTIDRARNGGESVTINHMGASIIGGIQPDRLSSMLLSGDDDGLTARFMYVWPEPLMPSRPKNVIGDHEAWQAFQWLDSLALQTCPENGLSSSVITLPDDVADKFQVWRESHIKAEPEGALASWWGKVPGMVLRLSLSLEMLHAAHFTNEIPQDVSGTVLEAVIELVESYFKPMAKRCYGDASLPQAEKGAATLAKWINNKRPEIVNVRELYRNVKLSGLDKADKVKEALNVLEEADWVRPVNRMTGGRKKGDWGVNPAFA